MNLFLSLHHLRTLMHARKHKWDRWGSIYCLAHQFISVAQSCSILCDPMDCSTPGFLVHHQLLELAQTHIHGIGDAIQPSHPLPSPRPLLLLPSIFPSIRVFSNELVLHIRRPKYWNFSFSISPSKEYSELISFRINCISLPSKGLSRVFSNTTVQKFSPEVTGWCRTTPE